MRLEDITVAIRPRPPWEAVDLGFRLTRHHWRNVYGAWLVTVVPLAVVIIAIGAQWTWMAPVFLLWFKPAYDRVVLMVLSQAVFGAAPSPRESLASVRQALRGGLLSSLTWRRLDPARALDLPVWQLEGLRGSQRRQRSAVLQRNARGISHNLGQACFFMEVFVFLGALLAVVFMAPDTYWDDIAETIFAGEAYWIDFLRGLLYFAAISLVEPFYVGGSFGFYLNRRTTLEGWDIEIAFRRAAGQETATQPEAA